MKAVGISDIGRCRKNNEDAYYLAEEDAPLQHLYIVADGMGGCNAGEVASNGAIEAFVDYVAEHKEIQEIPDLLTGAFQAANKSVFDQSNSALEFAEMGTTMVAAVVDNGKAYVAHVGDSRAYLIRGGEITRITHDHSVVQTLVENGNITAEEARTHPNRNLITRALGPDENTLCDELFASIQRKPSRQSSFSHSALCSA